MDQGRFAGLRFANPSYENILAEFNRSFRAPSPFAPQPSTAQRPFSMKGDVKGDVVDKVYERGRCERGRC